MIVLAESLEILEQKHLQFQKPDRKIQKDDYKRVLREARRQDELKPILTCALIAYQTDDKTTLNHYMGKIKKIMEAA